MITRDENGKWVGDNNGNWHEKWLRNPEKFTPTDEDIACEAQLSALDLFEPLDHKVDLRQFRKEMALFENDWVPYLQKEGVANDREGMLLTSLPGSSHQEGLSIPEARVKTGNNLLHDMDFNQPTELYHSLECLHPILEPFGELGRTFLVKVNKGGFFPPHKDFPLITRKTFRICAFLSESCSSDNFEWVMDGRQMDIVPGCSYYVDTRKTHRTHSWVNDSIHLIVNVPKTWENVLKLCSLIRY